MIQQIGLVETVTQSAERFMKVANNQASELARQRVPGFQEHLSQKQVQPAQPPARTSGTVPPMMPRSRS